MSLFRWLGIGSLIILLFPKAHAQDTTAFPQLRVTPLTVKVRNLDGTHVCTLPRGTVIQPIGRDDEGGQIQIQAPPGSRCPAKGFIDIRSARVVPQERDPFDDARVDEEGLALRSEPEVSYGSFKCSLPMNTPLDVLPDEHQGSTTTWYKVRMRRNIPGCPTEGWVSASYLRPDLSFDRLPVVRRDRRGETEAEGVCVRCAESVRRQAEQAGTGNDLERAAQQGPHGQSPFITELLSMHRSHRCNRQLSYPCNRGLIQMPIVGHSAGFCGTHHYNPDRPPGIDAYTEPMTACSLVALAQEWKKTVCPQNSGCTLQWGDISHRTRPRFNRHVTHTDGECVDIRPMRKGEFVSSGLDYRSAAYDREQTKALIAMARRFGAREVIFNDPRCQALRAGGHHNHVHICFGNNAKTRATCQNLQVSPSLCPELQ